MHGPQHPAPDVEVLAADAELAVGGALRGVEVGAVLLLGLLVCPPLMILGVVVVVPALVLTLVAGLVVAVLSAPYLLVHHLRAGDRRHVSLAARRVRRAGRAVLDLAPHRIVSDAAAAAPRSPRPGRDGRASAG